MNDGEEVVSLTSNLPGDCDEEFMLMVMPSSIVASGKKMKCGAYDMENLLSQLSETLGVGSDIAISIAVAEGEEPAVIQSLDEIGSKATSRSAARQN